MSEPRPLSSNAIVQIGIVVRDIAQASQAWARLLGCAVPPVSETGPLEETKATYLGRPCLGRAKLAFFDTPKIQLELIEPIGGPSVWSDFLDTHGEGVHHLAVWVGDNEAEAANLEAHGLHVLQHGTWGSGGYVYADGVSSLGTVIELLQNYEQV